MTGLIVSFLLAIALMFFAMVGVDAWTECRMSNDCLYCYRTLSK